MSRKRGRNDAAFPEDIGRMTLTSSKVVVDELRSNLAVLWREGTMCDISILVGGHSFSAHRLVLCAASPYMKAMLAGTHFAESSAQLIELPELDKAT